MTTLSDGFESVISGVSVDDDGLEGDVGVLSGFDRTGFIRPAIASVTEPEVLSGVDNRAKYIVRRGSCIGRHHFIKLYRDGNLHFASSFFSSDFSFLATSFLKQTYKKSLNNNHSN